jgi:uncharacterized protein DUF397
MDLKNATWRKSKWTTENGGNCVEVSVVEAA